ncbi:Uncharacterised protein [Mycolicibacterium phlei]|jgi:hypothetical protein|uniref:Uncharacterized protein n=1 Tax=Mycolicibacterium phlei DSM 43239 = CCUG 21000 TaxID=1226750 RepID=A0A5N5V6F3_MYCPH|nr:hypothetical protein [Mycolicibacterium phlei]VEG07161.1 Uncharacterised protein [Mycobacteroides chelonae]AMO59029.1 hypothetical protein MPHLCCUG_00183 [Mycolicibacterium phlei]EID09525.1 hypothetical protein MPHLEI_26286 [Mycolicibacterium phlei RIVM601174]KAB7757248.1 hypothetical protein MPHL21000_08680 [Mycolicibacterium phlei DSM 43239 = CCUG 21000]KXW59672.1 hypothetical protein MPHL43070_26000 [Mycolicibacterium phlei DSM 43070]
MTECRACLSGLAHCHGTVIHHAAMRSECTDPDCVTPEDVHTFAIDCETVGCRCAVSVSVSAHRVG